MQCNFVVKDLLSFLVVIYHLKSASKTNFTKGDWGDTLAISYNQKIWDGLISGREDG